MKDNTATLVFNEDTERYHQKVVKENHICVTYEPDGQYRHHFTSKKVIAQELHSWMVKYGIDETVEVLGRDSTNKMSGWSGGSIAWM